MIEVEVYFIGQHIRGTFEPNLALSMSWFIASCSAGKNKVINNMQLHASGPEDQSEFSYTHAQAKVLHAKSSRWAM